MGASVWFVPSSLDAFRLPLFDLPGSDQVAVASMCLLGLGLLGVVIVAYGGIVRQCSDANSPVRPFGTVGSLSIVGAIVAALAAFLLPGELPLRLGRAGFMMLGVAAGLGTDTMLRTAVAAAGAHRPFVAATTGAKIAPQSAEPPRLLGRHVAILTLGPTAATLAAAATAIAVFGSDAAYPLTAFALGAAVAATTAATLPVPGDPRPQEAPATKRCMLLGNLHTVAFAACVATSIGCLGEHGMVYGLLLIAASHAAILTALWLSPRIATPGLPAPAGALLVAVGCAVPLCVLLNVAWLPTAADRLHDTPGGLWVDPTDLWVATTAALGTGLALTLIAALLGGYFAPRNLPHQQGVPAVPPSILLGAATGIALCGIGWVSESSLQVGLYATSLLPVGALIPIVAWATVSLADHLDSAATAPQAAGRPSVAQSTAARSDACLMPTASTVTLCALAAAIGYLIVAALGTSGGMGMEEAKAALTLNPSLLGGVVAGASLAAALATMASSEPGGARNHVSVGVSLAVATPVIVGSIGGYAALLGVSAGTIGSTVMLLMRRLMWSPATGHVVTLATLTTLTGLVFSPAAVEMSVSDTVHSSVPWLVALAALGGAVAAATAPSPVSSATATQQVLGHQRRHPERKVLPMSMSQSPQNAPDGVRSDRGGQEVQATHLLSTVADRFQSRRRPSLAGVADAGAPDEVDVRQPDVAAMEGVVVSEAPSSVSAPTEPAGVGVVAASVAGRPGAVPAVGGASLSGSIAAGPATRMPSPRAEGPDTVGGSEPAVAVPVRRPSGQSVLAGGHPDELLGGFTSVAADFIGTPKAKDS